MQAAVINTIRHQKTPASPRARVQAMLRDGVSLHRVTAEAGASVAAVKSWLEGDGTDDTARRIDAWLDELESQSAASVDHLPWVPTATSDRVAGAFEYARSTPTIALVYGAAGVSKTTTAIDYMHRRLANTKAKGRTFYFAADEYTRTPSAVLYALAEAVQEHAGVPNLTANSYRGYVLAHAILEHLAPGDLVIVDEAQHINAQGLNALRIFHDKADVGIVYLGNETVFARIGGKGRSAEFAQLHSRVGMRLHVPAPEAPDVDAVITAWGVSGAAERALLQQIARGPGGLRQLRNVVRQARIIARDHKRPCDVNAIDAAAQLLGIDR